MQILDKNRGFYLFTRAIFYNILFQTVIGHLRFYYSLIP